VKKASTAWRAGARKAMCAAVALILGGVLVRCLVWGRGVLERGGVGEVGMERDEKEMGPRRDGREGKRGKGRERKGREGRGRVERKDISLPGRLLADEEVGLAPHAEADLVALLADVSVPQRLQGGEEEGARVREVSDCQADVGDWHFGVGVEVECLNV